MQTRRRRVNQTAQITLYATVLALFGLSPASADEVRQVTVDGIAGLQFNPVRLVVEPGQRVELTFRNRDTMMHNLLIVMPGTREQIAEAALDVGMEQQYVPDTDDVLWATDVLAADETQTLIFNAPDEEGAYPYVCTFPGHAARMFGVMHVTSDPQNVPALAEDPDVPPFARQQDEREDVIAVHDPTDAPETQVRRTWVRDAGPSAIGVHAGRNLSYIWDADTAHLRYAWYNGFLNSDAHWTGNQSDFSEVQGHVFYRSRREFPIRLGDESHIPDRQFHGYRIIDGLPEFEYSLDGYKVRQYIEALEDETGLAMRFEIRGLNQPVYYVTDPDADTAADFSSSAGQWDQGVLRLSSEQAASFSIRFVERPGHAPIGYWSMNDDPWTAFQDDRVAPGRVGRSLHFNGHEKNTGIVGEQLENAMTFSGWVQFEQTDGEQFIFGQRNRDSGERFALMLVDGQFALHYIDEHGHQDSEIIQRRLAPDQWNHLTWTRENGRLRLYVNGDLAAQVHGGPLLADEPFTIGASRDEYPVNARLDEFRVWSRVLDAQERNAYLDQAHTSETE